jgi:hypothetical protein
MPSQTANPDYSSAEKEVGQGFIPCRPAFGSPEAGDQPSPYLVPANTPG